VLCCCHPPAPRTAQQVKGGSPAVDPSWQASLVRQIQRFKRYPPEAQSRKEQGVVLLSFTLDRNGQVLAHNIARSSGYADLDNEVIAMIIRAQPLVSGSRSQKGQEDFIWSTRSAASRRHGEYGSRAVSRPARPPGPRRRYCRARSPAPPTRSLGRPDAGLPDDQHILMVFDPITGDELGKRMVPLAV
jgi:TonB family protein